MNPFINFKVQYFVSKTYGSDWKMQRHVFPIYGMVLIIKGSTWYRISGTEYHVKNGDLVFFKPGSVREASTDGMTFVAIDFEMKRNSFHLPPISQFVWSEELERLTREFEFEWLQDLQGKELKCNALFLQILHCILYGKEKASANHHVEKIKRYIFDHFAKPIQVAELAELVGLSRVYCGALFREKQGMTIAEYANRIRVRKAIALLEEGFYDITEIAYMCGFTDVYYFSNTFKRIMGASPSKYRSQSLQKQETVSGNLLQQLKD